MSQPREHEVYFTQVDGRLRKGYAYVAPSGVVVYSTSRTAAKWQDHSPLHIVWSWASWSSMILQGYGHPGMRRFLARFGWWKMP